MRASVSGRANHSRVVRAGGSLPPAARPARTCRALPGSHASNASGVSASARITTPASTGSAGGRAPGGRHALQRAHPRRDEIDVADPALPSPPGAVLLLRYASMPHSSNFSTAQSLAAGHSRGAGQARPEHVHHHVTESPSPGSARRPPPRSPGSPGHRRERTGRPPPAPAPPRGGRGKQASRRGPHGPRASWPKPHRDGPSLSRIVGEYSVPGHRTKCVGRPC